MGLDISVYKITKEKTNNYFRLIDDNLNYDNDFPEWTKDYENEIVESFYDWDKYKEITGIDINNYDIGMISGGKDGYFKCYKKYNHNNEIIIKFADVPEKKVNIKVLYRNEVGYQRKGLNNQFYSDYCDGKIGYYVWDKAELKRYKTDYADNAEKFQKNIIDNFDETCVCTFDW